MYLKNIQYWLSPLEKSVLLEIGGSYNEYFYLLILFIIIINKIGPNPEISENQKHKVFKCSKWSFEFQKNKYISFIESN